MAEQVLGRGELLQGLEEGEEGGGRVAAFGCFDDLAAGVGELGGGHGGGHGWGCVVGWSARRALEEDEAPVLSVSKGDIGDVDGVVVEAVCVVCVGSASMFA